MRLAIALLAATLLGFAINFISTTGGRCRGGGCGDFPEWLFVLSGWAVVAAVGAMFVLLGFALTRRR
jgi:hypothetical protein